jgi:hypothetical protein
MAAMSEQQPRWLWDQPKSWHALNRALHDVAVLLNYLDELPDSRLLSYFKATQDRVLDGRTRNTVPPCDSYADFLDRLDEIAAAFQTGRAPPQRAGPGPVAFVDWSRDFLAAVAAPATASSIRLTRQYAIHRSRGFLAWLRWPFAWLRDKLRGPAPEWQMLPPLPEDPDDQLHARFARRLANWVSGFELATWAVVVFTVLVSIYALSGRLILNNEKQTADAWTKLDSLVEAQEDKTFPAPQLPLAIASDADFHVSPLCELVQKNGVGVRLAATGSTPLPDAGENMGMHERYVTARQAHLCDQRKKLLQELYIVTMHLHFWSSVIAGPSQVVLNYRGLAIRPLSPALLFGVAEGTLEQIAGERDGQACTQLASPEQGTKFRPDECKSILWTYIDRSRNVAESILGSITEYVLPLCYGLLGAMAAALRLIRRKVDAATLVPTDRARLQQGAVLGVLCGAVIGLFANQFGGGNDANGLGLSALAFIAGYNVDGVFRFLDELSDRVFGSATKAR